ncbi:MAG: hypothetical protein GWN67_05665 [Phycisphaerae bacterium]|nr:hypothetical protein [Phycisphaerae bacterium]NIP51446.1 hypothetical protein [Phycisphaerae bacterium]NIS50650.1 hypothetical protein [Phycisphaerae bacterium]NIU08383.1 hypothetical protein [Phycisphaerae bacterium]NIU55882.1 hypothetical protein [Phycisphaerae bacterium]
MSLMKINWNPDHKELRKFGIISLIASALIASFLYVLKGLGIQWAAAIFFVGLIIFISSLISLKVTRGIYLGLILLTMPIGCVVSFTLMAMFYFMLLTPLGLLFRLMGRDSLGRKFDFNTNSYWIARRPPENLDRYFHQF